MKRLKIRWKLTLWYGGVLTVVLIAFSSVVYLSMRQQMLGRIDRGLAEELADVLYEVKRAGDATGLLDWLDRRFARHEGFDFQITRQDGERFFASARLAGKSLPVPEEVTQWAAFESVTVDSSGRWRIVSLQDQGPDGPLVIQVARTLAPYDQESRELRNTFLFTCPLALLIAVSGGYFLAARAMRPVQTMTRTANQISADRLHQRLDVDNPQDELGALAQTLNQMIERLERSFTQMQRFTADAAHELRTPLAVVRNEAEVALRSPRSREEYCRVLENVLEETNRLSAMADQLLFLCRHDAGLHPAARESVALDDVLREVVGNMQLVAQEKEVSLVLEENPPCLIMGDQGQLKQVFYNLLDNAIKYTSQSGKVAVRNTMIDGRSAILVADTGVGISQQNLPRVFDRFYRVDPARSGDTKGVGLGLSICRSIITSMGGTMTLESAVGRGTKVFLELPIQPAGHRLTK